MIKTLWQLDSTPSEPLSLNARLVQMEDNKQLLEIVFPHNKTIWARLYSSLRYLLFSDQIILTVFDVPEGGLLGNVKKDS